MFLTMNITGSGILQASIDKMFSWTTNSLLLFYPDKSLIVNIRSNSKP